MVGAASVLTVVFTTRAGLAVHHDVIELLHLMGARDLYIARQFENEAMRLGLSGGIAGVALAALTLWALGHAAAATAVLGEEAKLLPDLRLVLWQWGALALLPLLTGFAAMLTARLTVLRALGRMP
jgi:cell division transport system permease protein